VSAQEQLQNELDEILNAKKSFINLRDLGGMDYLEMCIKETLRLFPSVPTIGRDVYSDFKLGWSPYNLTDSKLVNISQ